MMMQETQNYSAPYLGQTISVKIDRPLHSKHPKHGFVYETNYGFVPETKAPDGEEIDAYVLGISEPVDEFTGRCIAVIHRTNDDDDKLIIVPDGVRISDEEIRSATLFQEQFFKSEIIRKKVYAEIGFGNDTFLSTEFEEGSEEYRVPKFVMPGKITSYYFRFWIFKTVFILSTNNGFEITKKNRNKLKFVFGIGGDE